MTLKRALIASVARQRCKGDFNYIINGDDEILRIYKGRTLAFCDEKGKRSVAHLTFNDLVRDDWRIALRGEVKGIRKVFKLHRDTQAPQKKA